VFFSVNELYVLKRSVLHLLIFEWAPCIGVSSRGDLYRVVTVSRDGDRLSAREVLSPFWEVRRGPCSDRSGPDRCSPAAVFSTTRHGAAREMARRRSAPRYFTVASRDTGPLPLAGLDDDGEFVCEDEVARPGLDR